MMIQAIRIYWYSCLRDALVEGKPVLRQPALLKGFGKITFNGQVIIGFFPSPSFLSTYAHLEARKVGSRIAVGNGTFINNNFCAISEHSEIEIGENCRIGCNVEIYDSDFHGVESNMRNLSLKEWSRPVKIGNNVFIGSNVKILKGVLIGDGAVIALGSVVTSNVSSYSIVGGNPAVFIRNLEKGY